ncbi:DUF1775 domain-containing protein [Streptomyces pratens]|uniref:DUF1775 domain-containing protein n=1 Tax=Streptomyces pratens TaxID=887456 RepID=A0ABW1LSI9_9ACTN
MFPFLFLERLRAVRRPALVTAATAAAVLLAAGPAAAHVHVESDNAQALAQDVTLTFAAASESADAGITQLRVVLPEGIEPTDVTYGEGPKGWKLTVTDDGYTVKGPAVKAGEDVEHSVVVRQLPDAKELAFKTLQSYSDGRIDRWIELAEPGGDGHGHGNEAPVLELEAAAPGAASVGPSPTAPESAPAPSPAPTAEETTATPSARAAVADSEAEDSGLSSAAWAGIVAVVLAVAAVVAFLVRRRGAARQ